MVINNMLCCVTHTIIIIIYRDYPTSHIIHNILLLYLQTGDKVQFSLTTNRHHLFPLDKELELRRLI